jgi:hypothetical protein
MILQINNFSLNNNNEFIVVKVKNCAFFAVGTGLLNIIYRSFSFIRLNIKISKDD